MKHARIAGFIAKFALSAAAIVWLASTVNMRAVIDRLVHADLTLLAAATFLTFLQVAAGSMRWYFVLRSLDIVISVRRSMRWFASGVFLNVCLPGGVGGDAYRIWVLTSHGEKLSASVHSVVIDRIFALLGLFIGVIAIYPVSVIFFGRHGAFEASALVSAVGLAGMLLFYFLPRFQHVFGAHKIITAIFQIARATERAFTSRASSFMGTALSIFSVLLSCAATYLVARSMSLDTSFLNCLVVVPTTLLFILIPISVGGWGLREGAMVVTFGAVGVAAAPALAISILVGLLTTLVGAICGLVWLFSTDAADFKPA